MSGTPPSTAHGIDPAAILPVMLATAQRAGDLVLAMQARGLANVASKSNATDLVTEADVASEQLIRHELAAHFPTVGLWGEESNEPPDTDYFWIVDPIDGTTNFAHGLPYFAVNIALNHGMTTLLGVTLELPSRTLYFARAGHGAHCRTAAGVERPLRVNQAASLDNAFLTTGFPYHRTEHTDNNLAEFNYFTPRCQGVRVMGAAALDLANVAAGAVAGYWEGWLNAWDAAPGVLLVREAGGMVTDYLGRPWHIHSRSLIASNGQPALHAALVDGVQTARRSLTASILPSSETA